MQGPHQVAQKSRITTLPFRLAFVIRSPFVEIALNFGRGLPTRFSSVPCPKATDARAARQTASVERFISGEYSGRPKTVPCTLTRLCGVLMGVETVRYRSGEAL